MAECLLSDQRMDCKNCYKCIRHCPVKSIRFSSGKAQIIDTECILCGQCYLVCPQNVKIIRDDLDKAKNLIRQGAPVYASIAPSFVANYPGATIASMRKALKALGFADAQETAVGAEIVKTYYDQMIDEEKADVLISSCCHSINLLIQKHYPEALPYLAPVLSPMQAHCSQIKKEFPEANTVFIGPCISKKDEGDQYPGIVDCVLTFPELTKWLLEAGVQIDAVTDEETAKARSRIFPTSGGILRSMFQQNPNYSYLALDGVENCKNAIEEVLRGNLNHCFIEMSSCSGSCINGPAMEKNAASPVMNYKRVADYAGEESFGVSLPPLTDIRKAFRSMEIHPALPDEAAILDILRKMGKNTEADELNCGSCGYNTCREKAIAVFQGKADLNMCLPFLKEKAESFSDTIIKNTPNGIIVLNEQLEVQQINAAARKLMNIRNISDVLGDQVVRILDPNIFLEVLENGRNIYARRVYLAEYRRYVEQTVIYDRSYHVLMSFMRDVTDEEAQRTQKESISQQTIEITDKVIDKQMRVVQEIASLLGETTAETKIALTKLKESLKDE